MRKFGQSNNWIQSRRKPGIASECRFVQLINAKASIDVTLVGIMIVVNLEHSENAKVPIVITLVGMLIDCRLEHLRKAELPIDVTLAGIVYS